MHQFVQPAFIRYDKRLTGKIFVHPGIKDYAAGEREAMYKLVFRGAKLSYIMMLTLSLPVAIEAPLILGVWLKEVPDYTVIFLKSDGKTPLDIYETQTKESTILQNRG